jgi:hypothetical protein
MPCSQHSKTQAKEDSKNMVTRWSLIERTLGQAADWKTADDLIVSTWFLQITFI